jgi:transcription elongation factor Elf1
MMSLPAGRPLRDPRHQAFIEWFQFATDQMTERFLCPKCGKNTMVKVPGEGGKYTLQCELCGLKRGKLPPDKQKDVI